MEQLYDSTLETQMVCSVGHVCLPAYLFQVLLLQSHAFSFKYD